MPSLRETQYCMALAKAGYDVSIITSTSSCIWKHNRDGITPTVPDLMDRRLTSQLGIKIIRRRPLFRLSDFQIICLPLKPIIQADIIHIIEFRQGFTLLAAILAKLFGKTVLYDHEQRGDRNFTWLHRIDSIFRNLLIKTGSLFVDHVRHTVHANRAHFLKNALRKPPMHFAPLGAAEGFFFDYSLRQATRQELGLHPQEIIAITSGKVQKNKRVEDICAACKDNSIRLIVVGSCSKDTENRLRSLDDNLYLLPMESQSRLNALFNAADIGIFTTFTISYWEAATTGLPLLVPNTSFSRLAFQADPKIHLFGNEEMFLVPEEQYHPHIDLHSLLTGTIQKIPSNTKRKSDFRYSWISRRKDLLNFYESI